MKRYASIEQIKELTDEQFFKLEKLLLPKSDQTLNRTDALEKAIQHICNIGEMIQLFKSDLQAMFHNPLGTWNIQIFTDFNEEPNVYRGFPFYDVLFEAMFEELIK